MKNIIILILTTALSLMAEEPKDQTITEVGTITGDWVPLVYLSDSDAVRLRDENLLNRHMASSVVAMDLITNVIWHLSDSDTNVVRLAPWVKTQTNWLTIERSTNTNPATLRQIGQVQTNQMLTLIYQGRTNNLIIGLVGKSPWYDEKRITTEPAGGK